MVATQGLMYFSMQYCALCGSIWNVYSIWNKKIRSNEMQNVSSSITKDNGIRMSFEAYIYRQKYVV